MDMVSSLQTLRATIGNPASRAVIKELSLYCPTCQKNRLEVALELYTGTRSNACFKCKLAEKAIVSLLSRGMKAFDVSKEDMKNKFSNPSWRKALVNVIKGIGDFGIKKPFVPGSPFLIVWDITYACNLNCKHCYANAGKKLSNELDTEEAKQVIDQLDKASVPIIAFSGGEPLVRQDIFELTKYAHDKGIYVALATNGTLISKKKAREMKHAGIEFVQISLDGSSKEIHDTFRGIDGVFDKAVQGIKNVVAEDFFVNIATTATQYNYKQIPEIIELSKKLQVKWFMMYNFVPTGRGEFIANNDLDPDQREELLFTLWKKLKNETEINVLSTAPQFARVAIEHESADNNKIIPTQFYNPHLSDKLINLAEFIGGCGAGRFYMAIRPNGNIEPCVFFPLTIGNIINDDFETLWKSNPILKDLRDKNKEKGNCGNCKYRYYCGGCRARAYSYLQDYLREDIGCIYNKESFQQCVKSKYNS
jgi:radical SAM protein with 4Fe4S-binding SPASM domain